jgi:hypothetical protein
MAKFNIGRRREKPDVRNFVDVSAVGRTLGVESFIRTPSSNEPVRAVEPSTVKPGKPGMRSSSLCRKAAGARSEKRETDEVPARGQAGALKQRQQQE